MENSQTNPVIRSVLEKVEFNRKHQLEHGLLLQQNVNQDYIKGITAHKSETPISSIMKRVKESVKFRDHKSTPVPLKTAIIRWTALAAQLFAASFLPAVFVLSKTSPLLTNAWRFLVGMIIMTPAIVYEYKSGKYSHIYNKDNLWNLNLHLQTILMSFYFCGWGGLPIFSYFYAPVMQVNIFNNLQIIIIFIFMIFMGYKFPTYAYYGMVVFGFGVILVLSDTSIKSHKGANFDGATTFQRYVYGYLLAFIASLFASFYFRIANKYSKFFTTNLLSYLMSFYMLLMLFPSSMYFENKTFSFDVDNGIWGLFSETHFILFLIIGGVGLAALILSSYILSVFDPFIINALQVTKPILSSYIVGVLGIQSYPGFLNLFGCCFVFLGLYILLVAQLNKTEDVKKPEEKELDLTKNEGTSDKSGYYYSMM